MSRRVRGPGDGGFTLLELLVAMTLFGILAAISVAPYRSYQASQEHIGSTRDLVSLLRRTQLRAVAAETTMRVDFASDGSSATALLYNGTSYVAQETLYPSSKSITYGTPSFEQPAGGQGSSAYFYGRGTASKGQVLLLRRGQSATHTVTIEGLTARVAYS